MWKTRQFADAAICCQGASIRVHRAVLAAASPVFKRMFEGSMQEGRECRVELRGGVEAEIVEAMLQCIYTGDLPLPDCLIAMLALADQYAIDSRCESPAAGGACS